MLPAVRGVRVAKWHAVFHSVLLLAVTVVLVPLQVAGLVYLAVAVLLGLGMVAMSIRGLSPQAGHKWARQLFAASLVYLPLLFAALAVDALV